MRIVLVRHGETSGNASRTFQMPETPLSPRGMAQADRLAGRLAADGVAQVVSSDYARARMTAEAVSAASGAPLRLTPGLRERNFGALRGRPYAEIDLDPFAPDYVPPGGESWAALHARVDAAWEALVLLVRSGLDGDLVVVTHGLVCLSLVSRRLLLPDDLKAPAGFANTSVTIVDAEPPWRVSRVNCTAHLDDPGSPVQDEAALGRA